MTEALAYGITSLPLETLLTGGTDPSYSSTEYFVQFYADHYNFLLQLIVSRGQRMAGSSFYVGPRRRDAPDRVEVIPRRTVATPRAVRSSLRRRRPAAHPWAPRRAARA